MNLALLAAAAALATHAAAPSRPAVPIRAEVEPKLRLSSEPKASSAAGERLVAFGIELSQTAEGLRVDHVLASSDASAMGFKAGDILLDVGGAEVSDAAGVAQALGALKPETRLWAVVRRDQTIATLESELPKLRLAAPRDPQTLSPLETELVRQHIEAATGRKEEAIRALVTPRLDVAAGQRTWIQFPAGLPATLKTGDLVEGLLSTGLAADSNLDYLAIAPRSQVWAEVVESEDKGGVRSLRLHVFKLRLRGGHSYPVSARVVDLTGDRLLTQLSSGGTIVSADPAGLGPDVRLQIELLKALSLFAPPASFRAGPGLWFKQRGAEKTLEVSHVVAGRAGERAGIKVGDVVLTVGGTAAAKLGFVDALDRLYGPPGTNVAVRVQRGKDVVPGLMDLDRGVQWGTGKDNERKDERLPVPPPYKP